MNCLGSRRRIAGSTSAGRFVVPRTMTGLERTVGGKGKLKRVSMRGANRSGEICPAGTMMTLLIVLMRYVYTINRRF